VDESRLSQLTTRWTLIFEACRGPGDAAKAAQAEVLTRYCGAIYRYALRVLGDDDLALEACQEFALRFVRGDFRAANPAKGRFRDYVKTAVSHLLGEFRRQQHARRTVLPLDSEAGVPSRTPPPLDSIDAEFHAVWRQELLNRTWRDMEEKQETPEPPYYAALWLLAQHPNLTTAELVERLATSGQRRYTDAGMRQLLHRARKVFADLLLDEVARSIFSDDPDRVADELADLDLLTYCRAALARRRH
jgi:DNA-directed RNA polymerase specialized sigma24 family protein